MLEIIAASWKSDYSRDVRWGQGKGRCIFKAAMGDAKRAEPKDTRLPWRELVCF